MAPATVPCQVRRAGSNAELTSAVQGPAQGCLDRADGSQTGKTLGSGTYAVVKVRTARRTRLKRSGSCPRRDGQVLCVEAVASGQLTAADAVKVISKCDAATEPR